ncbi:MAG: hypothetical protein Q8M35_09435, partial [Pseudohongiella sp.]|nr:hypothetical protein [Pseudohongiella sp.]
MFKQMKNFAQHLLRAAALLCAWNLLVTSAQAQPTPASPPPLPEGLQTLSFFSPAVGREMKF